MALDNPENQAFLQTMRERYGDDTRITTFGMEMYNSMKLMEAAAKDMSGGWSKEAAIEALEGASFTGPGGSISFDPATHHAIQDVHLAEIKGDASFELISTEKGVRPDPGCAI
jgi:branched-chain amino acid transport system substrate-binding protein